MDDYDQLEAPIHRAAGKPFSMNFTMILVVVLGILLLAAGFYAWKVQTGGGGGDGGHDCCDVINSCACDAKFKQHLMMLNKLAMTCGNKSIQTSLVDIIRLTCMDHIVSSSAVAKVVGTGGGRGDSYFTEA